MFKGNYLSVSVGRVSADTYLILTHRNIIKSDSSSVSACECVKLKLTHSNYLILLYIFQCVSVSIYNIAVSLTHCFYEMVFSLSGGNNHAS
jgi:hypothetical protein